MEMESEAYSVYLLGEFRFAPRDHSLSLHGEEIHLRPKTFQVLQHLVERHGHLVTREELLDAIWPEIHVDETVLSRSVWEVREALKRDGDGTQFIQTVPKVGYQFVGPVRTVEAREAGLEPEPEPRPRARRRTKRLAASVALAGCVVGGSWWVAQRGPESPALQAVPLTTDPGMENWPSFSPDGSHVAYQGPAEGDELAILVKQIGEEASLRRTYGPGFDHAVSWSPDGRWIAFLRGQAPLKGPLQLMLVPPVAGAEREITRIDAPVGWGFRPAWTPDSRALIVPDREGAALGYSLYRVSIDDGHRTRWTFSDESLAGEGDKDPAISPDGTRLAFVRNGDLHLTDLDDQLRPSGRPRKLADLSSLAGTREMAGPWGLAWTADSREIVFPAGDWPRPGLFRVSTEGGPIRPVTSLASGTFAPAISRVGSRLAYMEWMVRVDIWQVRLDEEHNVVSGPTRLISSSRLDSDPVLSPDGERIAFHSNRTGSYGIWVASASGSGPRPLGLPCRDGDSATPERGFSWSPDQGSIAFASGGGLFVVDSLSGRCRALTTGSTLDESPVWSPDGRWVYFSSRMNGVWQVSRVPAGGGRPEAVTRNGGRLLTVSPDGLRLYYAHDEKLWAIPAGGGEALEILDPVPDYVAATERGLFLVRNSPERRLEYFDLASRTSTLLVEGHRWIMGLSASPDGRRLVYGMFDTTRADLMLVENFE